MIQQFDFLLDNATWRDGKPLQFREAHPHHAGDLTWMADDYRAPSRGGKWFCFDTSESIWRCLDPFHQTGINLDRYTPPRVNQYGRLEG